MQNTQKGIGVMVLEGHCRRHNSGDFTQTAKWPLPDTETQAKGNDNGSRQMKVNTTFLRGR